MPQGCGELKRCAGRNANFVSFRCSSFSSAKRNNALLAARRLPCPKRHNITMDTLLIAAASGMKSRMESLDMLANNIANTGTAGFKADREFFNVYQRQLPLIENRWTDFSQGSLVPTGNSLDLALTGPGFFA